nr:unnamed protein product [Trichobilharzia regenti]
MVRIEEVIIKSFLCVLPPINVACRMFPASKARCFELYGFDIIIDENFRPWLLEVNLSPSLVCDSPLDFKVKSHMLTDLFNLVGITCHDPSRKSRGMCNGSNVTSNGTSFVPPDPSAYFVSASDQCFRNASTKTPSQRQNGTNSQSDRGVNNLYGIPISGMMPKEINKTQMNILRRLSEESARAGGWIRLYPNPVAWEQYAHLFPYESNKHNNECNRIHYNEILYTSVDQYNQSSDKSLNDIGNSILMDAYNAAYASYILQSVSWSTSVLINQLKTTDKLTTGENTTDNLKDLIGSLKVPEECTYFHPNYAPGITNLHCLFSRGITHRHSFSNDIKVIQKPTIITSAIHQKPLPLHNVTPSQLHNYITNFIHTPTNDEYGSSLRDCRRVTLLYCYVMNHMPYFLRKLGRKPKILPGVCLTPGCLHNHASKNNICGIWQICKSVNSTYESPLDSNTPHTASNCQDNNVSIPEHISNSANTNENKKDLHSESLLKPTRIKSQQRNTSRKHKHSLVVNNASKLSPIQARHAFTAYLSRIQNRLVIEADQCSAATNQYQNDDEEIKLLIKFLHTASANLSSSQNPLKTDNLYSQVQSSGGRNQRESKLELARLLNEFINVYQYETVNNKQLVRSGKVTNCMKILNSTQFWRLIRDSNESDLESLLAEYTRLNKSVDVFLGRQDDKSKKRPLPNLNNQKLRPFKTGSSSSDSGFQSINEVNSSPPAKNDSNPIGKQRFLEHLSNSKMHNHCSVDSSPSSSFFSSPTSSSMSLPNESSSEEKAIHSSNKDVVNSNKNYKQKLSTMNINYSDKPEYCQKCTFINPVKSAINLLSCGKCISSVTKTSQQNDISPTEGDKRNENKVDPKDDSPLHAEFCMSKKDRSCQTIKSSGSQTARRPQSSNKSVSKLRKPIKKVNRRKVQPLVYSTRNNTSSSLSLSSFGKQNNRINTQDQRRFKSNCALRSNKLANSPSNNRVHEKNNYKPRNSNTVKKLALVPGINPPICKPVYMLSADKSLSFIHLHGHNNSCENDSDKSDSKTDGEYVLSDVCLNKNCRTDKSKFNRTSRRIYPLSSARKTH